MLLFLLSGCSEEQLEGKVVFILEGPEESIKIKGEIGEKVIIPELIKDDYVFIGWTDGVDYYAGLTEVVEETLTLRPEYVPVESVFKSVEVSMGQVSLLDYYGDSDIVGLPTYWNGYLVVGFSSDKDNISKLFLPSSIQKYYTLSNLSDFVIYGDVRSIVKSNMIDVDLLDRVSTCSYIDGSEIDQENLLPGVLNEECSVRTIIKRNDEDAVFVPGKRIYYTYDVITSQEQPIFNLYGRDLEYISFSTIPDRFLFIGVLANIYPQVFNIDDGDGKDFKIDNNMITLESSEEKILVFVYSEDKNLVIDNSKYDLWDDHFYIHGKVESIEIKNSDTHFSEDGIVYSKYVSRSDTGITGTKTFSRLVAYPLMKSDKNFVFPANMNSIHKNVYNEFVESITINQHFRYVRSLSEHFPNLKNISVSEDNPFIYQKDGAIISKDTNQIEFINSDVSTLTIEENTSLSWLVEKDLNFLHLGKMINEEFFSTLNRRILIENMTIDPENPYMYIEDGVVYSKTDGHIYYLLKGYEEITIKDNVTSLEKLNITDNDVLHIRLNETINGDSLFRLDLLEELETITVEEDNPYLRVIDNVVYSKDLSQILYIPKNADIKEINIGDSVTYINLDIVKRLDNLENIIVSDNNPIYKSIDGILYNKDLSELLLIPNKTDYSQYKMPDTIKTIESTLGYRMINFDELYIGRDFELLYEYKVFRHSYEDIEVEELQIGFLVRNIHQFNKISIHKDSPYFNKEYNLLTSLNGKALLGFIGEDLSYEIPDSIEEINPSLFNGSLLIEDLILSSSLEIIPSQLFSMNNLKTLTIKGESLLNVEGLTDNEMLNSIGDNYIYYFNSSELIVYVDASMVEVYQNHQFWSLYEIREIE